MTNEEIKESISKLNNKKKKITQNMSICGVLLVLFVYDYKKFLDADPKLFLIVIYTIITIAPIGILIWDYIQIRKIKSEISELQISLSEESETEVIEINEDNESEENIETEEIDSDSENN